MFCWGWPATGCIRTAIHLVRKVVELSGLGWDADCPFSTGTLGEALLTPTRLYVKSTLAAIRAGGVHALAHITGGGLTENIPRVLPDGMGVEIDLNTWELPPVFKWITKTAGMQEAELLKTFNAGLGMVLAVSADQADAIEALLVEHGERVSRIGHVTASSGVSYSGSLL